jgi:PhoH-like ATPase
MIKNYVIDTNVLIHDPRAIFKFQDNNIFIPFPVIEEIDKLKTRRDKVSESARSINRILDGLRGEGNLKDGIKLENGGFLRVMAVEPQKSIDIPRYLGTSPDDSILYYAMYIKKMDTSIPTILVTKDLNLRIKADSIGIVAQDYLSDKIEIDKLYRGYAFHTGKPFKTDEYDDIPPDLLELDDSVFPNLYLWLNERPYRYNCHKNVFSPVNTSYISEVFGIRPKNYEQIFAFDALLDPAIPLVSLVGIAGTGKTLLSVAAGLKMILESKFYKKMLVSKPVIPMGKDIGYLPGSIEDKMKPWLQPVYDNLEFLSSLKGKKIDEYLSKKDIIEVEVLSYIRGRSIPNQYIIIDEAQNLTPHEIKTIITRAGEGTKIVLTGDPFQIDNPYLDNSSNGLVYVASKFRGSSLAAHVSMFKGERSELASKAAEIL